MEARVPLTIFALLSALSATASASEEGAVSAPTVESDMHGYYAGERGSAHAVLALSTVAVASGSILVTRDSDFSRGMGWPLLVLGLVEGIGAAIYDVQVGRELAHYQSAYDHDPEAYRQEELMHIRGTSKRFVYYRLTELGLTLGGAGVATYGFLAGSPAWQGVGLGVAAIAVPFLVIDTINDARARRYRDHLEQMVTGGPPTPATLEGAQKPSDASNALAFEAASRPFMVSFGGRF